MIRKVMLCALLYHIPLPLMGMKPLQKLKQENTTKNPYKITIVELVELTIVGDTPKDKLFKICYEPDSYFSELKNFVTAIQAEQLEPFKITPLEIVSEFVQFSTGEQSQQQKTNDVTLVELFLYGVYIHRFGQLIKKKNNNYMMRNALGLNENFLGLCKDFKFQQKINEKLIPATTAEIVVWTKLMQLNKGSSTGEQYKPFFDLWQEILPGGGL